MSDQMPLFVEDLTEAIRATIMGLGGYKKVGAEMRPEMLADAAGRWLADCLNPDRRDKLCPDQLAWLRRKARQEGVHILTYFEARDAGYSEPQPIEPEDERAKLQREFISATKGIEQIMRRLEAIG